MLPTQPADCGKRWWQPPDLHYTFKASHAWPGAPLEGAAAGVAEGAAATLATSAAAAGAGAGAGGLPPRGPGFGYHHYHSGYPHGFRGHRRWGGRPSRLVWFAIGAVSTGWWYSHYQRGKDDLRRYISDPGSWKHSYSHNLPQGQINGTNDSASTNAAPLMNPVPQTQALPDECRHWGWKSWAQKRDEHWARKYEDYRQREDTKRPSQPPTVSTPEITATPTATPVAATAAPYSGRASNAEEVGKIRESIEKIWDEKRRNASEAQEKASEQARDYAAQKLDKLSAALEALRESLKHDSKPLDSRSAGRTDGKWV